MILDGKAIAQRLLARIKADVERLEGRPPALAVVLVGDDGPSKIYVGRKTAACEEVGIHSIRRHLPSSISEDELLKEIDLLNINLQVDGILVQLPLPKHIDSDRVTRWINPEKDVDGFHPFNVGRMLIGEEEGFKPCTPLGVKALIEEAGIGLRGKHVVIVGRSNIVGKPLAALLMQRGVDATVTVAHSRTENLQDLCLSADILVAAVGIPRFIKKEMVREGASVIDVGINREGKKLVGDVDFDAVKEKCAFITPVPGGVGPMTIAMLLQNTLKARCKRS